MPLDEALAIAKQIAEALDAAHELGIIHRDLKPANVKLRDDGTVKVLDFGLAKLGPGGADAPSAPGATHSPTLSLAFTGVGMILGTAAYMSPEQARGKTVDKRADIWAFGCVLFEMLTGRRAFDGTDATEIIAAVVRGEPEWSALPPATPPKLIAVPSAACRRIPGCGLAISATCASSSTRYRGAGARRHLDRDATRAALAPRDSICGPRTRNRAAGDRILAVPAGHAARPYVPAPFLAVPMEEGPHQGP